MCNADIRGVWASTAALPPARRVLADPVSDAPICIPRVGAHCFDHPVDECRWAIGQVFYACRGANVLGAIITVHDGVRNVDSATL